MLPSLISSASLFRTNWKNVSRRALSLFPGSDARFMDTFFSERTYPTVPGIDGPFSRVCLSLYLLSYATLLLSQVSDPSSYYSHEAWQKR